jgi:hypothetical protein
MRWRARFRREIVLWEVTAMPADDSLFEKALARQMRTEAVRNGETAPREAGIEQQKLCPDAEILAAYNERLLSSDEMNLWKEHIFSCARCQEILSQLEATEDVPVAAGEEDQIPAVYEDARAAARMPPPAVFAVRPAASAAGEVAASLPRRGRTMSYWIAPAGAIAAALLVWIGMHQQSKDISRKAEVESAENRQTPVPTATPPAYDSTSTDNKGAPQSKIDAGLSQAASEQRALAKKKLPAEGPTRSAPSASGKSAGTFAEKSPGKPIDRADAADRLSARDATQNAEVSGGAEPVSQAPTSGANVATPAPQQGLQTAPMPAAPSATAPKNAQAAKAQAPDFDAAAALMRLQAQTATVNKSPGLRAVSAARNISMIPAPGGKVIWRVGKDGLIEQSTNAGAVWLQQDSGVTVTLDSGSAPSEAVCWVFGRAGTILQTVDGGGHWTKIVSPIAGDIGGILAADAQHATIWDAGKKNNFVTADGGATWTRIASPW